MKPIYFLLFSLLTLLACTDQQTELEGASHTMRFGVEGVEDTKGAVINTQNILSMSVFCTHTGTEKYSSSSTCDWMHNVQVTRADENSEWIVQDGAVNKWAGEGYHSFFAFAPHAPAGAVVSASTDPGPPTLTYTVPENFADQVDLLYSQTTPINCKQMYIGSRPVVFGFSHALSKITFEVARAADVDPSTYFAIDQISLQNIHSTGTLSFEMDPELKQVIGAEWSSVSGPGDYTVQSVENKGLKFLWTVDYQMHPISEDNTGLFVLPQKIEDNAVMRISFFETINGDYSPNRVLEVKLSDLLSEFQFGKAYRFSIVLKMDKVIIKAKITDWDDQPVDVAVPGTYLNVSNTNITAAYGSEVKIFYATDAHVDSVKATCDKGISFDLNKTNKYIYIPSTTALGDYTFTLTAEKLSRKVNVKIRDPFIAEDGVAAPRIFVQGTGDDAKLMLTKNPANYGVYFQFGGIIAWEYIHKTDKAEAVFSPVAGLENHNSLWTSSAEHTLSNLKEGKGDPCRLVGYTKRQVQNMLQANTLPDNNKWKTPEWIVDDPIFHIQLNRNCWDPEYEKTGISGHYFPYYNSNSNFLPACGLAWASGWMDDINQQGAYWTSTRTPNSRARNLQFNKTFVNHYNDFEQSCSLSVRCVRQ